MSKLHKIRRDIIKDPEKYLYGYGDYAKGVNIYHGKISVSTWSHSHRNFVKKVLKELGKL